MVNPNRLVNNLTSGGMRSWLEYGKDTHMAARKNAPKPIAKEKSSLPEWSMISNDRKAYMARKGRPKDTTPPDSGDVENGSSMYPVINRNLQKKLSIEF